MWGVLVVVAVVAEEEEEEDEDEDEDEDEEDEEKGGGGGHRIGPGVETVFLRGGVEAAVAAAACSDLPVQLHVPLPRAHHAAHVRVPSPHVPTRRRRRRAVGARNVHLRCQIRGKVGGGAQQGIRGGLCGGGALAGASPQGWFRVQGWFEVARNQAISPEDVRALPHAHTCTRTCTAAAPGAWSSTRAAPAETEAAMAEPAGEARAAAARVQAASTPPRPWASPLDRAPAKLPAPPRPRPAPL